MNIRVVEKKEELQVIIECRKIDEQVHKIKSHLELLDSRIQGKNEKGICLMPAKEALYFESVDDRTFMYTREAVLEIKQRLYELESILSDKDFLRISKSVIVNVNMVESMRPEVNRTILLTMCNKERLSVSRKYVKAFRELIGV